MSAPMCDYCGGKLEASAPLWIDWTDGGVPYVFGIGSDSLEVFCKDCGNGDTLLTNLQRDETIHYLDALEERVGAAVPR